MGVSGSGKSTVGKALASRLRCSFFDADDFHPPQNVDKMKAGIPLTDEDRLGWLNAMHDLAQKERKKGTVVIACSALKEAYREILSAKEEDHVRWIYLKGSFDLIESRMKNRTDHFMPPGLLRSQFEILEEPAYGLHIDIKESPELMVDKITNELKNGK